ncbi:hypothetical protein FB451DRAFT_1378426 [Mycena latifolia]|nr:hypothetical protein FB451DRAFT_1378426 [Mycena latifolia]
MSSSSNPPAASGSPQQRGGATSQAVQPSVSNSDWLATSLVTAKAVTAGAELLPFPYVKGVFGTVVIILETIEKVKKNREDLKDLCSNIMEIIKTIDTPTPGLRAGAEQINEQQQLRVSVRVTPAMGERRGRGRECKRTVIGGRRRTRGRGRYAAKRCAKARLMTRTTCLNTEQSALKSVRSWTPCRKLRKPKREIESNVGNSGRNPAVANSGSHAKGALVHITIQDQLSSHGDTAAVKFKGLCENLERVLQDILKAMKQLQKEPRGFSGWFKEIVKLKSTTDEISGHQMKIQELRLNFLLMAAIDTNLQVYKGFSTGIDSTQTKVPQSINNCPPPTRIFHGRKTILDKMHQYFTQNMQKQCIFLLHGLGGAGKTLIALKFIEQSVAQFTDIFVIDTSTVATIDAGLKMIATTKSVGDSSKDALQWLRSKQDEWLLLFDNADDPKINLNNYFPQCSHGNIIITSRNPGLCVYAGSHCTVSDMEEEDAADLLLTSAAQDITDYNEDVAAQIVKALHYLPLAIIQAGAFISKSGNLGSYLALYEHNKARLLTEQPVQTHDNYSWTVYTTWQISFEQLSEQAKTFLKLCSFLHYHGISDNIFKNATNYVIKPSNLSKEELEMPVKVLLQFSDPSGTWDPLRFTNVTNEIRAYSLINFDPEKNMFSIHPLVHDWTRSTLSDETCHQCMVAITGISLRGQPEEYIRLASLWMLPHIDLLINHNSNAIQDFRHDYAKVYLGAGKPEKAAELGLAVLEQRKKLLGEDHPGTLDSMYELSWTYAALGRLNEAAELGVSVWEKRREILGDNHPDTLGAMGDLASTYQKLGKLKEAEELQVLVLQKRRTVLGDNHLQTLRAMGSLATTYIELGRPREAEALQLIVLDKQRSILGNKHPETLLALGNLGGMYTMMGQPQDAEVLELEVLENRRDVLGDKHPDTLRSMSNLAYTYHIQGKLREAEQLALIVVEDRRNILGDNHPDTLLPMGNLAATYNKLGRLQEAEQLEHVVLEKRRLILGDNHIATLRAMSNLASTLNKLVRWQEAEELLVVALEEQRELLSAAHPHLVDTMQTLVETYTKLGKLKEAEDLNEAMRSGQA